MNHITLNDLNGQSVELLKLTLERTDVGVTLQLTLSLNGNIISLGCENVHGLTMDALSYPLQIAGFEIVDNCEKGWDDSTRYTVRDYEDGILEFHCEKITLL